jgi:porin
MVLRKYWLAASLPFALFPHAAEAQTGPQAPQPSLPRNAAQSNSDAPSTTAALPTASQVPEADRYARLEALGLKGWITPFPRVSDTILRDAGGLRSTLADAGIGFLVVSKNTGVYNLRHDDTAAVYNGRRPTYSVGNQSLYLTYDMGKLGIDGGQLQFLLGANTSSLPQVNGPRFVRIGNLAYFQSFADDLVELKIGYFSFSPEFGGTQIAGNLASGTLGPSATIPVQAGFPQNGLGAPAATLRVNGKGGLYAKFGIQRSFPSGGLRQAISEDSTGLRFGYPGAKPLLVQEVGLNRRSAPNRKSFWVRGGVIYNTSRFTNFKTGDREQNWAGYLAVDRQLSQFDQSKPFRGLYVGGTVNYAPPHKNLYSQYYEGRVYGVGIIESRPSDLATLVVSYNKLSHWALDNRVPNGNRSDYVISAIASYSYQLMHGLYVQPGFGLVKNPTYRPAKIPLATNGYLTISFLF